MNANHVITNVLRCVCITALFAPGFADSASGAPATGLVKSVLGVIPGSSSEATNNHAVSNSITGQVPEAAADISKTIPGLAPKAAEISKGFHLPKEIGKAGETIEAGGKVAEEGEKAIKKIGGFLRLFGPSDSSSKTVVADLDGTSQVLVADGIDVGRIKISLPKPATSKLVFRMTSSGGKLSSNKITIEKGSDTGE